MSYFIGWDLYVQTDPKVIVPLSVSFKGDLFEANYTSTPIVLANCINDTLIYGNACGAPSGSGIVHFAAVTFPKPSNEVPPVNGLIFNITYAVVTSTGFSKIDILDGATLTDGTTQAVIPYRIGATYGTPVPDFTISASPSPLVLPLGSSGAATIMLTSQYQFEGVVDLSVLETSSGGPRPMYNHTSLSLKLGGSNSTGLIVYAPPSLSGSLYSIMITGTGLNRTNSITLPIYVRAQPFFELKIDPGLLRLPPGYSGSTTVLLQSQEGFSGKVNLTLQVPTSLGVLASLGESSLKVEPGSSFSSTILNVSVPVVYLPFIYRINVTAVGAGQSGALYAIQTLIITPPPATLSIAINPSTITAQAGHTIQAKIVASSVNYFWGFVYVSAVMNGGTASFDESVTHLVLPDSATTPNTPTANFTISISVYADAVPGDYVVLVTVYSVETYKYTLPNSFQISYISPATMQVAIPVRIENPSIFHNTSSPTIFGLSPTLYFIVLGVLATPFVVLTVQTYRKRREDSDDFDWKA